jgi:hypothetical protein
MATQPYSFQLQALGGVPPYAWTIVGGFGTPPTGMNLVVDTLTALAGAIAENEVGTHGFRIRVTDSVLTSVIADVTTDVRPYGFTRAFDFLLDPQVFALIQAYLSGEQTPEKVQQHFFRDISTTIGEYFLHMSRDILVEDWLGLFPFHAAADEGLRDVLDSMANDLLYFANPLKTTISAVIPGPGTYQVTYTLSSTKGAFIGRTGETDAAMARLWFRLMDCDSEDEPHDGNGNPLTIISIVDANGVEINPNTFAYQSDTDGFHTGKDGVGTPIGFDLTFVFEYVPNPDNKIPPPPWCMRYGEREELHDIDPEAFIKFGNVIGEVDADVIALIKSAPFVAGIRVGEQVVNPLNQIITFQGQNGLNIEADLINGLIRLVAPDSVRTINQVPTAGAGDLEIQDGEFIEVVSEVADGHLTIRTAIPIQANEGVVPKGLISELDYGRFLQLIGSRLVSMHKHQGRDLLLGLPGDGSWSDGWIPLDENATLPDTLDRINEALLIALGAAAIAGLDPDVGWVELSAIARDKGFLAFDGATIYEAAFAAGSEAPYVYNVNEFGPPSLVETAMEFYVLQTDSIDLIVNGAPISGGVLLPAIVPPIPPGATVPIPGLPLTIVGARASGPGFLIKVELSLDLVTPDPVFAASLVRGYNYFEISMSPAQPGYTGTSGRFKIFTDVTPSPSPGGFALPATVFGDAPGRLVLISGIEHYSGDNELLIDFTGNNTFQDTYYQKPYSVQVKDPSTNLFQEPKTIDIADMTGVSVPPAATDNPVVTAFPTGRPVKDYSVQQDVPTPNLRLNHMRPGGSFFLDQMPSLTTLAGDIVLYTIGAAGTTDTLEDFEDERYRLNKDDAKWALYAHIPVMVRQTFHWHSQLPLYPGVAPWGDGGGEPGQLQVIPRRNHGALITAPEEGVLAWPSLNYNVGSYAPAQDAGRDYGNDFAATAVCIYDRAMVYKDGPRSHGKFRIEGITSAVIGQSYLGSGGSPTGDVNLEIKFPGSTPGYFSGWLDLSKLSLGGGYFADGDGCRVGSIVDVVLPSGEVAVEIEWTGNGLSTVDSGEMLILRVTYRATSPAIYKIEEIG